MAEYKLDASQRSRAWITLWRELDRERTGRVSFETFTTMLRARLSLLRKPARASQRKEVDASLQALWRAIADDGDGEPKGYLTLSDFLAFMRTGAALSDRDDADDQEQQVEHRGWRARVTEQRRVEAVMIALAEQQWQRAAEIGLKAKAKAKAEEEEIKMNIEMKAFIEHTENKVDAVYRFWRDFRWRASEELGTLQQ